jgi:uncharacterized membrane protein YhiD involved in acid resistance
MHWQRAVVAFIHPGLGHKGGSRLANIPNVEGLTTAARCYPATVSGLVSATRMTIPALFPAFLSSYYPRLSINR